MSAKISPARRAVFMEALEATGNFTVAAERAEVSRSWVNLRRADDASFRRACDAALRAAKARLGGAALRGAACAAPQGERSELRPPFGWETQEGEELVVKGTNGRRIQIARARLRQWTPRIENRFLAALAGSCNVKLACAEVGLSAPSAYKHRERWPAFAARWDAAIAVGCDRLDRELVTSALRGLDPEVRTEHDWDEAPIPPMSVDEAIRLTGLHLRRAKGVSRLRSR